jgi:hypothetical protein
MAEIITVKDGKYAAKDEVEVVITTDVVSKKISEGTEKSILATIDFLNEKKKAVIAEIDAEIEMNKEMLIKVQEATKDIVI